MQSPISLRTFALAAVLSFPVPVLADTAAETGTTITGEISLAQAISLSLVRNPALDMARLETDAATGQRMQAGALLNPELAYLREKPRNGVPTTTWQLNQPLELGGKRSARIDAADAAVAQSEVAYRAKRADVRAATVSAYVDVQLAQEQLAVARSASELASRTATITDKRLQAGKIPPLEQLKAKVAQSAAEAELQQAEAELRAARYRLAAQWNTPDTPVWRVAATLPPLPALPPAVDLDALVDTAPDMQQAQHELTRRQAMTAGERAKRVPDITLSFGNKQSAEASDKQTLIGVSLPLPLFDRNRGNVRDAISREDQARTSLAATRLRVRADLDQGLARLQQARQQTDILRQQTLPAAQQAADIAARGYELGKFSLLDLIDAQRSLLHTRQQALRATSEAFRAAAEFDRLTGKNLTLAIGQPQE